MEITTFCLADLILYGALFCVLGMPIAPVLAYGVWLLTLGNGLGVIFILPPLALIAVIVGCVLLGAMLALNWTRVRLTEWLADADRVILDRGRAMRVTNDRA